MSLSAGLPAAVLAEAWWRRSTVALNAHEGRPSGARAGQPDETGRRRGADAGPGRGGRRRRERHDADRRPSTSLGAGGRRGRFSITCCTRWPMAAARASASWSRPITRRSAITTKAPDARHVSPSTTRCSPSPTAPPARCKARRRYAGRDPFLVLNSDNLYPAPVAARARSSSTVPGCRRTTPTRWYARAAFLETA